ncbi:Uncharacterised protein [uncultured archaeon]|nr:Uncharacterised protein [uncultured archaeon]
MTNDGNDMVEMWKQQAQERKAEYQKAKDLQARVQKELNAVNKWYDQARALWRRSRKSSPAEYLADYFKIRKCYYERAAEAYGKHLGDETAEV